MRAPLVVLALVAAAASGCIGGSPAPDGSSASVAGAPGVGASPSPTPAADSSPSPSPSPSATPPPSPSPSPSPSPPAGDDGAGNGTDEEGNGTPQASPPDWGSPQGKAMRPGINTVFDGSGCTTNFLFTVDYARYFLGSAAHCVANGSNTDTNGCTAPLAPLGSTVTLRLAGGGTTTATLAYNSWNTMQRIKESDNNACQGNDFALLELRTADLALVHPASLHFEGPTALATAPTTQVWGYGASSLKLGFSPAHPKQGVHIGTAFGGWSHWVYLVTPGIPGDSGGFIMTQDGKALGVASTIVITPTPAANLYTDIGKALAYARTHEGIDARLVTWEDFHGSLV